ncbi:hypothetical protein AC579_8506 [Pseudocercospora musae]|uniref:Uncharacterized protein n=1 Tax=Pseudocercospora musae TaxID=113226 RepID=A0A139IGB9_9PEZI|nr:hypothetical protein AC579_8506 [Pseudocercospora musae]
MLDEDDEAFDRQSKGAAFRYVCMKIPARARNCQWSNLISEFSSERANHGTAWVLFAEQRDTLLLGQKLSLIDSHVHDAILELAIPPNLILELEWAKKINWSSHGLEQSWETAVSAVSTVQPSFERISFILIKVFRCRGRNSLLNERESSRAATKTT